jgi:hypothetical protein
MSLNDSSPPMQKKKLLTLKEGHRSSTDAFHSFLQPRSATCYWYATTKPSLETVQGTMNLEARGEGALENYD